MMDKFNKMFNITEIPTDQDLNIFLGNMFNKNINEVKKNNKKNSRARQNKINEASKKSKLKKNIIMKLMANHIIKLHSLILCHNNIHESDDIVTEILSFDSNILN